VKAIVERHGGRVSAVSAVGQGTTIRLELPSSQADIHPYAGPATKTA